MTRHAIDLEANVIDAAGMTYAIAVELLWDPDQALAVQLVLPYPAGPPAVWDLSRDFLAAGLKTRVAPMGGDVAAGPWRPDPRLMVIRIQSDTGYCLLLVDRCDVEMFLSLTYERVPYGAETVHIPDTPESLLTEGEAP